MGALLRKVALPLVASPFIALAQALTVYVLVFLLLKGVARFSGGEQGATAMNALHWLGLLGVLAYLALLLVHGG